MSTHQEHPSEEKELAPAEPVVHPEAKALIEALIFSSFHPLSANKIKSIIEDDYDIPAAAVKKIIHQIREEYESSGRGFEIVELGGGYHMRTKKSFAKWLEILLNKKKKEALSPAALETLSIIAYRQPVTKAVIEDIRGVNADGVVQTLLQRGFVTIQKKKDAPLVPYQYVTTDKFLEHFGLRSLADLPKLEHRHALG